MNYKSQRYCVWAGAVFLVTLGTSMMLLMDYIPPPSPTRTAEEIVAHFHANEFGMRFAMWIGLLGSALLIPFSAAQALQMSRVETGRLPVLSVTAFGAGAINAMLFILPFIFWAVAFYRHDRNPELVLMANDVAWLEFVMAYGPYAIQQVTNGIVGLSDKRSNPVFPRWYCFMCLWFSLMIVPGGFAVLFQTGPFAWNGLLAFWIPVGGFSIFMPLQIWVLLRAVKHQELEEGAAGA